MRKLLREGVDFGKVAEKAVAIIKGKGYNVVMFTLDGMETSDPEEARRFYVKDPNFMVTIDEDEALIRINKNSNVELNEIEASMKQLKNLAREYMLKSELKVFGKEIAPKDFAYQAKKLRDQKMNGIKEASFSRLHGHKKTSYQTLESTKLIVRHRKPVDEEKHGARSRQIKSIFIERAGERFKFPHNHLAGARAMARHLDEGGEMRDEIGTYIIESTGNLIKLVEFANYARRNKLINEDSEDVVKIVRENIAAYKRELQKFQGVKTYESMCKKLADRDETNEEVELTGELKDMFTVKKFDEKIGETLPLIKRLVNEKNAWRSMIEEASEEAFVVTSTEDLIENDAIEFDSPIQKLGYKIRTLSERVTEENDLSKFVHKIGNKMIEGNELSRFEKSVMRNVLEHIVVVEEEVADEDGFTDKLEEAMTDFERKMKLLEFDLEMYEAGRVPAWKRAGASSFDEYYADRDDEWPAIEVSTPKDALDLLHNFVDDVWHERVSAAEKKMLHQRINKNKKALVRDVVANASEYDDINELAGDILQKHRIDKGVKFDADYLDEEPGDWDHGYNYEGPQRDEDECPHCHGHGEYVDPEGFDELVHCPHCDEGLEEDPNDWSDEEAEEELYKGFYGDDNEELGYDPDTQWMDPAGGIHYHDEDDPAAMYEEARLRELAGLPAKKVVQEEKKYKLNKNGECAFCKGEGFDPRDETYGDICPACDGEISPEMGKMMKRIRVKGDGVYNATAPGEDPKTNY